MPRSPRRTRTSGAPTKKGISPQTPNPGGGTRRRKWLFRLSAAFLVPLLLLLSFELVLRLAGYGYPTSFLLRRELNGTHVLTENQQFGWRFFGPALARTPRPLVLPEVKAAGTCRIFIFGESAAYGDPNPDFGLPRVLEALLHQRLPQTRFEVVNAAMTGINSNVILPIARDCAREHGDIWVIYMGNNEVVGPFGGGTVFGPQTPSLGFIRGYLALKATRLGQLFDNLLSGIRTSKAGPTQWGMSLFVGQQVRRDDSRMQSVYRHFGQNLADMLQIGRAHGVGIVLCTIVTNLRDCAPFGSQHRSSLAQPELDRWNQLYAAATQAEQAGKTTEALEGFRQAAALDEQFAELQFRWARGCLALGQAEEARAHFILARDYDTLRFRADSRLNSLIREAATGRERERILLADADLQLSHESPYELPGSELLFEHVHFNLEGNYRLARCIGEQVLKLLPESSRSGARPEWASLSECSRRLAWTDWARYKTLKVLMLRLNEPPFNAQFDFSAHRDRLEKEMEGLLPSLSQPALKQATEACKQAMASSPQDWVLVRNYAELQLKLGDTAGAEASCRQVSQLLPFDSLACIELGSLLIQANKLGLAVEQFQKALELDSRSTAALNGWALACIRLGRTEEALGLYRRALRLQPGSAETHLNLGTALEASGAKEEAKQEFRLALQDERNTPEILLRVGKTALAQGWVAEAIDKLQRASSLNPTDAAVHYYLGGALDSAGRTSEAKQHFLESARLEPGYAGAHLGLGLELRREGKDAEALEQFAEAARLNPRLLEARLHYGLMLLKQRRNEEARRELEAVLELDPKHASARKYLEAIPR